MRYKERYIWQIILHPTFSIKADNLPFNIFYFTKINKVHQLTFVKYRKLIP